MPQEIRRDVVVTLSDEHLRSIADGHCLKPDELSDDAKLKTLMRGPVDKGGLSPGAAASAGRLGEGAGTASYT